MKLTYNVRYCYVCKCMALSETTNTFQNSRFEIKRTDDLRVLVKGMSQISTPNIKSVGMYCPRRYLEMPMTRYF